MKMLTKELEKQLIENYKKNLTKSGHTRQNMLVDHKPVVKLFGGAGCTWLISEYNPDENIFFGLCDLGMGEPELGYVSRQELESLRFLPFNLPIERDLHWEADKTLTEYADEARKARRIIS